MAGRMVGMRFRIEDEANRHRGELLDDVQYLSRLDRVLPGVDHHDAILGENNAGVGKEIISGDDIDPVGELFDLRPQILSERGADKRKPGENRQRPCRLECHGGMSSLSEHGGVRRLHGLKLIPFTLAIKAAAR